MDDGQRTCSYCLTRAPLTSMQRQGTSWVCTGRGACESRAAASGLYAMPAEDAPAGEPGWRPGRGVPAADPAGLAIYRTEQAELRADQALSRAEREARLADALVIS